MENTIYKKYSIWLSGFYSFLITMLVLANLSVLTGQVNYNQRDDKYRLLGLKRAKELYEVSRKEYERAKELYSKKYMSEDEFERVKGRFSDAEVNYQQSLLAVLFEQQFVTVQRAVKYQLKDGSKHVKIRLANTSGGTEEFQKLINIDDKLFRSLQPDVIGNVYVSLSNEQNAIIGQPYEAKISQLQFGKPQDIDFKLLQDLDAVMVNIIYGNGSTRSMKIFLQKDASQNIVAVQSEQFSQEAELGKSATFDLTLELFSGMSNTFSLEVVNLPEQIDRFFKDPQNQARLSQFKFTENVNTRKAALEVSLPDRPTSDIAMDKPIEFYVLVVPNEKMKEMENHGNKIWLQQEIENLGVGYARLELVPRGKGILLVKAQQLYFSIGHSGKAEAYIDISNEGTRRLDNIELKVDLPLGWIKKISPAVIQSLGVQEEKRVHLEIDPPDNISVGRYEIRIQTTALTDNQPVSGEDKTFTIEVAAEANVFGTVVIVILIISLIGGIVIFGIKLSRK